MQHCKHPWNCGVPQLQRNTCGFNWHTKGKKNVNFRLKNPFKLISEQCDLLLEAELVLKTTDAGSRHIGWFCRQTTSDSLQQHGEFQMKRSRSLRNRKYCFCFCGVPVFRFAICLSAGFSLFNQSNMKQEIWSLPRDVHPSKAAVKTSAQLF